MDILYRFFYIVISVSIVTMVLTPVVIVLRIVLKRFSAGGVMWLWLLFFFRSICPVSISSTFSIIPVLNRRYHVFLSNLGLEMEDVPGIMTGWQSVLHGKITVNFQYAVCSILWLFAVFAIWGCIGMQQREVKKRLAGAKEAGNGIYQINGLAVPVMMGILRPKIYISGDMTAKEAKYILRHLNQHVERKDLIWRFLAFLIVTVQWFNPLIWFCYFLMKKDMEIVCDRQTIRKIGADENKEYAQEILHMKRGREKEKISVYLFQEEFLQSRATEMLYMKKTYALNEKIASVLLLFVLAAWCFLFRPLQILWNGGVWSLKEKPAEASLSLKNGEPEAVLAEMSQVTPEGLNCVVELVLMHDEKEGRAKEYALILRDMYGTAIVTQSLNGSFLSVESKDYSFPESMSLYASDYNGDGIQEVVLGQKAVLDDGTDTVEYTVWNIEVNRIKRIGNGILTTNAEEGEIASRILDVPEDTTGVISVDYGGKTQYYVWDSEKSEYVKKNLTDDDLENYRTDGNGENNGNLDGEKQAHKLEDKGVEVINVSTHRDGSGNEVIDDISFPNGQGSKEVDKISGYFCDLQWVQAADGDDKRYAVLTYNGTKAQTFAIYDVEKCAGYYYQEDGNSVLRKAFEQFDKNSDISINDGDVVVYSLMEKDGEQLKIAFAASISDSSKVSGYYLYNVESDKVVSLKYSR